jgi:precorrin-4 methylase
VNPPTKQDDESPIEYARRLSRAGHADASVRFSLTLPAGMVAAMADHLPAGLTVQDLTKTVVIAGLDHQDALRELEAIRELAAGIEATLAEVRDSVDRED